MTERHTILVVEDDESVREVLVASLERMGFAVLVARNGREALDVLAETPVALVISDVVMPEVGGFELAGRIAREHPSSPVLLISGYTQTDGGIEGQQLLAPGSHFLRKPFSTELLAAKVREILEG